MARTYRSTNCRTLGHVANMALKSTEKTAKWLASDPFGTVEDCVLGSSIMELQQRINFSLARMKLGNRRVKRGNDQHSKFVDTGVDASTYEVASGWIIDHLLPSDATS